MSAFFTAAGVAPDPAIAARLAALVADAEATHPDVTLPAAAALRYLGERYRDGGGGDLDDWLDAIDVAELRLVCACVAGDRAALARFERDYLGEARAGAARLRADPAEADEIVQEVRAALLAPRDGAPPRLAAMTARGDLRALIRLVAVRAGLSLRRRRGREIPDDLAGIELAADDAAPALALARAEHRAVFTRALEAALARLDARARTAIKLHSLDGVSLAQVAAMFRVDRSTVARWIAAARQDVLAETRRQLAAQAGVAPDQFDSFVDVLRSEFAISLRRMLT